MRQGQQQNRRGRGRGGRKGQNPLSRSFESSGPDIKIRGTAQHIAEKYMALARDAIGSGDLVLGENYLQHAEHYNRIIMAAQVLPQGGFDQQNSNGQRIARPEGDLSLEGSNDGYDGDDEGEGDQPGQNGGGYEQPRQFEGNGQREQQPYQNNQNNQNHQGRNRDNRNYEPRNHDNRGNQQRNFEPRNRDGNGGRDFNGGQGQEPRGGFEPRYQEQPQPGGANGDQPRPVFENREPRPPMEARPGDAPGPRGRRRRGRNDNGANRLYPPQVNQAEGGEPQPANDGGPEARHDGDGGAEGQD